jgi:hypothetical protein
VRRDAEALASAARALAGKDDYRRKDALRLLKTAQGNPRAADALAAALRGSTDAKVRAAIWKELCDWPSLSPAAIVEVTRGLSAAETRADARAALLLARSPAASRSRSSRGPTTSTTSPASRRWTRCRRS